MKVWGEKLLRRAAANIYNARDGYPHVNKYMMEYEEFIGLSPERASFYAEEKLKSILAHATVTSPYYQHASENCDLNLNVSDTRTVLHRLPFLTKNIIQNEKMNMISRKYSLEEMETSYTGGSSGTPTSFFRDKKCTSMRMGRQRAILDSCGYSPGDRSALIWGVHEDIGSSYSNMSLRQKLRKFAAGKEPLCCTILDGMIMQEYHKRLLKFRPDVLYGYPNAMSLFAEYIRVHNLKPVRVKTIICTAERLTELQRDLLSDTFGGEVFNLYCTREHGCIGFECKKHRGFHLDVGSVFIEIIRDGQPVEPGLPGEIVITDLLNYGMPFIRNKIGDWGSLSTRLCDCGSPLPLLENLGGRETEMLYRPDGRMVSGIMLVDLFSDEPAIQEMQVIQESLLELEVKIVVNPHLYSLATEKMAIDKVREIMGEEINIDIHTVKEIPRNTHSGKFQEVICRIKNLRNSAGERIAAL
jgi:phenylacetate-CoA ligase